MVAPQTETICRTIAQPCSTPPVCPVSGATIATDGPFAPDIDVETVVPFAIDVNEIAPDDADSANDQIVVGNSAVYSLVYSTTYGLGPPGGTITVRIKVNGITQSTFVHPVATAQTELLNISLDAGDALTVTVEPSFEGASVLFASLQAMRACGPVTDVIEPQG